ncbi:MAG: type II toxin-antitoxin system VapC family toxin [Thermodesulfobacteriota bacterium]
MIVLDTNVIVAFLDKKDTHYKNSVWLMEDLGDERVYILNVNLAEVYSVIARRCRERKYNCKDALGKLRELEANMNVIWIDNLRESHGEIVDRVIESEGRLNYNDAVLLKFVRDSGAKLITLDRYLKENYEQA